jgi:hypothetical protein
LIFFCGGGGRGRVGGGDKGPSRRAVRGLMGIMTHAALEQVGTWKEQGNRPSWPPKCHIESNLRAVWYFSRVDDITVIDFTCRPTLCQSKRTTDSDERATSDRGRTRPARGTEDDFEHFYSARTSVGYCTSVLVRISALLWLAAAPSSEGIRLLRQSVRESG